VGAAAEGAVAEAAATEVLESEVPAPADEGHLWLAATLFALLFPAQSATTLFGLFSSSPFVWPFALA
jgi:hypothetical protein